MKQMKIRPRKVGKVESWMREIERISDFQRLKWLDPAFRLSIFKDALWLRDTVIGPRMEDLIFQRTGSFYLIQCTVIWCDSSSIGRILNIHQNSRILIFGYFDFSTFTSPLKMRSVCFLFQWPFTDIKSWSIFI